MHACSSDPFQILMIDLFIDFGISSTFNIDWLVDYKGLDVIPLVEKPSSEPIFPFLSPPKMVRLENI